MLAHRVTNVDDVDVELFGCVFSPAKRRGPVPGRSMLWNSCRSEDIYSSSAGGVSAGASIRGLGDRSVSRSVSNTSVEERGLLPTKRRASGMSIGGSMSLAETVASNEMGISQPLAEATLSSASFTSSSNGGNGFNYNPQMLLPPIEPSAAVMQQHILSNLNYVGMNNMYPSSSSSSLVNSGAVGLACAPARVEAASGGGQQQVDVMANAQNAAQQQLAYVQQLQLNLQMQAQKKRRGPNAAVLSGDIDVNRGMSDLEMNNGALMGDAEFNLRPSIPATLPQHHGIASAFRQRDIGFDHPDIHKYLPLLHPSNSSGMHLRACYTLVFGGLLGLPPIPTNEEYCRRFGPSLDPGQLPQFDIAALHAARFAELAMGALTNVKHGDMTLLVALTNASVSCLRCCAAEKVHPSLMLDVARAYFFNAILRAHLDDMERYFKYRRICLIQLAQLDVSGNRV